MKLINLIKQYGILAIPRLIKAVLRRFGVVTETFVLLKYDIKQAEILETFRQYNYSDVVELSIKDIYKINFLGTEKIELFKNRFLDGNYSCFAIIKKDEVQYLTWISWKYMNYPNIFQKSEVLQPYQALLEDSFCSPEYRGKGFHSRMNVYRLKKILKKNKAEVLALVLKENKAALKVQLKSGFTYYSRIRFIKIGSWSKTFKKMMK